MITGRDMKTPIAPAQNLLETRSLADVSLDRLKRCAGQAAQIGARPQQRFHSMASCGQFMHQVSADEPRCAGNEAIHWAIIISSPGLFNRILTLDL